MLLPAWVPAGETKPAPDGLLLVQSFVNTRDADLGTDLLTEAEQANEWLHMSGLLSPDVVAGPRDLRTVREVREAIRALIAVNSSADAELRDADRRILEQAADGSQPRLSIDSAGHVQLAGQGAGGLAEGLLNLLLAIRDAQRDGTWDRLKVCGNRECQWAFYDRSHSRRGAWCDMAACGNMIKNRNLRARRGRSAATASLEPDSPS